MGSELWTNTDSEPTGEEPIPYFIILLPLGVCFVLCWIWKFYKEQCGAHINSPGFEMDDYRNGIGSRSCYRMPRYTQAKRYTPIKKEEDDDDDEDEDLILYQCFSQN